jgi:hypothetical protein
MVETVGIHQVMWFVMLESAKDQVIPLIETFVTTCSDLWAMHQRKCKNGKKEVSLVA